MFCMWRKRTSFVSRKESECSAVGSVLRSGRRGRAFESPHSDNFKAWLSKSRAFLFDS